MINERLLRVGYWPDKIIRISIPICVRRWKLPLNGHLFPNTNGGIFIWPNGLHYKALVHLVDTDAVVKPVTPESSWNLHLISSWALFPQTCPQSRPWAAERKAEPETMAKCYMLSSYSEKGLCNCIAQQNTTLENGYIGQVANIAQPHTKHPHSQGLKLQLVLTALDVAYMNTPHT